LFVKVNEFQEYFLGGKGGWCVELTTLQPSCAESHEIWEPQTLGTLRVCPGVYRDCFTFALLVCKTSALFYDYVIILRFFDVE
jgi:hypothetical protein